MKNLYEERRLTSCHPESRFSFLQYVKNLLDELRSPPIEDALARDFMAEYAETLAETGQNAAEAAQIFFSLFLQMRDI
jgi:hypothetical protein